MVADKFDITLANSLPNGAQILERRLSAINNNTYVVLCCWKRVYGNVGQNAGHEYVTWRVDSQGNAFWGHYFRSFEMAAKDYSSRL